MKIPAPLVRLRNSTPVRLMIDTAQRWSSHRASSKGAALALYMVFSLAPILLLVIAIAGFFFGEDAVRANLVAQIRDLTGQQGAEAIQTILASAQRSDSGWMAAMISVGLLIFSSTTAFNELKDSLDELWDVPQSTERGAWSLVRSRALSLGLVLVLALFLLMSLTVNAGLAALQTYWGSLWQESTYAAAAMVVSNIFSFAVVVALFAVVFKLLPSIPIAWSDVMLGALVTAIMFTLGKFFIGLYLSKGSVASSFGAAGSVIALILWIWYSAQIFFFGAAFTRQYAEMLGSKKCDPLPSTPSPSPAVPTTQT